MAEIWANETAQIAWNYITLVEATANSTRADIYRYENRPLVHGLPQIETRKDWSRTVAQGLRGQSGSSEVDDTLRSLVQWATDLLPEEQVGRTPLYFYGTGSFRNLDKKHRHEVLRSACQHVRDESKFLVNSCGDHVIYIDGEQEAILGLVTLNNNDLSLGKPPSVGLLSLSTSSAEMAYYDPLDSEKSELFRLGLRDFNGSTSYYDLHAESHTEFLEMGPPLDCVPRGLGDGTGDWEGCITSINEQLGSGSFRTTSKAGLPSHFTAVNGFEAFYRDFGGNIDDVKQFCEQPWNAEYGQGMETACFLGATAASIVARLPNTTTIEFQETFWPPADTSFSWTGGRAFLYAMVDMNARSSPWDKPVGLHRNIGSRVWQFGPDDSPSRPKLGRGRDWYSLLEQRSHRLWGGVVLFIVFGVLAYLLLGRQRRIRLYQKFTKTGAPPSYDEQLPYEEFELEDREDEYDIGP